MYSGLDIICARTSAIASALSHILALAHRILAFTPIIQESLLLTHGRAEEFVTALKKSGCCEAVRADDALLMARFLCVSVVNCEVLDFILKLLDFQLLLHCR